MTRKSVFTDEELNCFIDNEADQVLTDQITATLAQDPVLRQRYDALRDASDRYKSAFEDVLSLSPDMPAFAATASKPKWNLRVVAASMVAGAALALGTTLPFFGRQAEPDWKDVVANYQSLYVTETLSFVQITPNAQDVVLARLSTRLGFDLEGLPVVSNLDFVRAQELGFQGRPLAQLTFLNSAKGPVALCIVETGNETSNRIQFAELHGLDTYSWTQDGFGILLIGPMGDATLEATAVVFQSALKADRV